TSPGVAWGGGGGAARGEGPEKWTFVPPPRLESFALWIEQLVAESTGKNGAGIVPVAGETPQAAAAGDRVVVIVKLDGVGVDDSIVSALKAARVPMIAIDMSAMDALGAEFFRWEIATATAGRILEINPFDEPNVQQAKDATHALLDAYATRGQLPVPAPDVRGDGVEITFSAAARKSGAPKGLET